MLHAFHIDVKRRPVSCAHCLPTIDACTDFQSQNNKGAASMRQLAGCVQSTNLKSTGHFRIKSFLFVCLFFRCYYYYFFFISVTMEWEWWLFPRLGYFGRMFNKFHSSPALFYFFFRVEISSRTQIPHFRPGSVRSGSAS